jgi:G3E family GTPase
LQESLLALVQRPEAPEQVIIETSGVADPKGVVVPLLLSESLSAFIRVDGVLTVVDAEHIQALYDAFTPLITSQLNVADLIILNKIDLVSPEEVLALHRWIRGVAPTARILETRYGAAPLELLLDKHLPTHWADELATQAVLDVHLHHAEEQTDHPHHLVFHQWSYTSRRPFVLAALQPAVRNLPLTIYRAKGLLFLADQPERRAILHVVGRRVQVDLAGAAWGQQPPVTHLVLIGAAGGVDPAALTQLFDGCLAV